MGVFGKLGKFFVLLEIVLLVVILIYVIQKYKKLERNYPQIKNAREGVAPAIERSLDGNIVESYAQDNDGQGGENTEDGGMGVAPTTTYDPTTTYEPPPT